MTGAPPAQKAPRQYQMHGDSHRQRLLKQRGIQAIDARSRSGRAAKAWSRDALRKKGGRACAVDMKMRIEAASFYLWRALELRAYLVSEARKRGTVINRRSGKLPPANEQYDTAMSQFLRISDELQLDKGGDGLDLARRLQLAAQEAAGR